VPKILPTGAALAPALFVLVSMCGSPVPPPPGSIAGFVFYDANHNAIHDDCDSNLAQAKVVATAADGTAAEATTDSNGTFRIEDAAPGATIVTIVAGEGFAWPITTTPEGAAGTPVHVESNKETAGVEIGSASRSAFDTSRVSIIGVIFDDENENGLVDPNECGGRDANSAGQFVRIGSWPPVTVGPNGAYELRNVGSDGDAVLEVGTEISYVSGSGYPDQQDLPEDHPCLSHTTPQRRYSANLFEANIALSRTKKAGTVSGHIFDDVNANGVRDPGEPGISRQEVYLNTRWPTCGTTNSSDPGMSFALSAEDGAFTIHNVPLGIYTIQSGSPHGSPGVQPTTIVVPRWTEKLTVTVRNKQTATLDLPLDIAEASTFSVLVFDDRNGDGARTVGEDPIVGYWACVSQPRADRPSEIYVPYTDACGMTGQDGIAIVGPLAAGTYNLPPAEGFGADYIVPLRTQPAPRQFDLAEGEQLDVSLPLDVIPPSEQLVAPGTGTPIAFETCFSDPAWVQVPFDEGYANAFPFEGPQADEARSIYNRGIYTNGYDFGIWGTITGKSDWTTLVPGCFSPNFLDGGPQLFVFVDYEPTAVVSSAETYLGTPDLSTTDVLQITLRRTPGLYAISLPRGDVERLYSGWYLFVDDQSNVIERIGRLNEGGR
jgi:hypothetical protein